MMSNVIDKDLGWKRIVRKMATKKGIDTKGMKKDEIIKALKEV